MAKKCCILILLAICYASPNYGAPSLNAHDLIMEANLEQIAKRNAEKSKDGKQGASEDKIVKINEALGVDLFEGDMVMSSEEINKAYEKGSSKRSLTYDRRNLWRTRTIPYLVNHSGSGRLSSEAVKRKIIKAMNTISSKVPCLKFREMIASDERFIRFHKAVGCWSYVGMRTSFRNTDISLGDGCFSQAIIIHEIIHALGFFHEQSRPDRNSFITVYYENINPAFLNNFLRISASQALTQDTPYDYKSIMHYSNTAFTKNRRDTIRAKYDHALQLGGIEMSEIDILELNKAYQCHVSSAAKISEWTSWTVCLQYGSSCKKMRQRYCFSTNKADCPGVDEYGVEDETQLCSSCHEPKNGHWGNWGSWGACSKTCDEGIRTRRRKCDNPIPSGGGKICADSSTQTVICRIKKCNQEDYDTSFEDDWGMWKQSEKNSGLNWVRHTGPTPTLGTGPNGDHTTKYGYYAYVEAGLLDHKKKVFLKSAEFPAKFGNSCLTFYYSMNGKNMGELSVTIRYDSGSSMMVWDKAGHQGTDWKAAAAFLPMSDEKFTIEIQAIIGFSPESDIAIDDVFIDKGKCMPGIENCRNLNEGCADWVANGECHKNPSWMLRNCCTSCRASMGACTSDRYGSNACAGYVRDYGCTDNGKWMWSNCCKSCNGCLDSVGECKYWASIGECDRNPAYMKENCKISCKFCKA